MILSEAEAKRRWCPFARAVAPVINANAETVGGVTANRRSGGDPDPDSMCLASGCMAWQHHSTRAVEEPHRIRRVVKSFGYCGLAGQPSELKKGETL